MFKPWRLANSLDQLRKQINALAPNRNKASDGTIGDAAHATGTSDHNPDANRVVKALDITHDPEGGCNCNLLAQSLVDSKDFRVQYIIWNSQISNADPKGGKPSWAWRKYTGSNPHNKHIHISVRNNPNTYDSTSPWVIRINNNPPPISQPITQPQTSEHWFRRFLRWLFGV